MRMKDVINAKRQLLVVDDQEINRELLGMILEDHYDLIFAENGQQALEKLCCNGDIISAVLLDLVMPVMNGFQVIEAMKSDHQLEKIPIIVLTAEAEAELETLRLGAASFIPKPFPDNEIILERVSRIVELAEDRKLIQATEKDELTGLYHETYFFEYAEQMERYHPDWTLDAVTVNVKRFHLLNERYGYEFGNQVLSTIGEAIRKSLSGNIGVGCRHSSDRFYAFVRHVEAEVYDDILKNITKKLNGLKEDAEINLHMGVYSLGDKSLPLRRRFDCATTACKLVHGTKTGLLFYDEQLQEEEAYKESLIHDLPRALRNHEFQVWYQPKFDITGEEPILRSAEALVRWKHPVYGMVSPGDFIPLFEEGGQIQHLDLYVWRETAKQLRAWKDQYGFDLPISVNLSRIDIHDPDLENNLLELLRENELEPDSLHLEVTESAYTDDADQLVRAIEELRGHGFSIEMDDFGAGYSSLNMLSVLPIDVLKMDMGFVRKLKDRESREFGMIRIISDIAKYLKVPLVAEGVETAEQMALLKEAECAMIQGYYFSRPVPAADFEETIRKYLERKDKV
ncbi:MAG: EAL domain-containing protein [Oscillospiraceae bacterium]|nr:EAL domain-containing protein [Oscillospiraceae bacterium]